MGLVRWIRKMSPEKKERLFGGLMLLGGILGRGEKALAIVSLIDSVPGRVDSLKAALDKIDDKAEELDRARESEDAGALGSVDTAVSFSPEELDALDDFLDLQSKSARALKRLLKRRG